MSEALVKLAASVLRMAEAFPSADYLPLDQLTFEVAKTRYNDELADEKSGGFLRHFDEPLTSGMGLVLDFGSGFGGRTVEFQRTTRASVVGLEIDFFMAAYSFRMANLMGSNETSFVVGLGEKLPFASNTFDAIFSYDVFEHVEDPNLCLEECLRVLKPGGEARLVFPPYFHPTGAHLEGYVSRIPYANLIFPRKVLLGAIDRILKERNTGYRPQSLRPRDKLYTLNGLTIRSFKKLVKGSGFQDASIALLPLFSKLNRRYESWKMRYYSWLFDPLPYIPFVQEVFTHRVVAILRKPA